MSSFRTARDVDVEQVAKLLQLLSQLKESNEKLSREKSELELSNKKLRASDLDRKDEIRFLKNDALSKEREIVTLNETVQKLELSNKKLRALALQQEDNIVACKQEFQVEYEEGKSLRMEITRLDENTQKLESVGARYSEEITALNERIRKFEAEEFPFVSIGKDVRARYLEHVRLPRTGKDYSRINSGNRAAHGGRPIHDALIFVTGYIHDPNVCQKLRKSYAHLYGVSPETMMKWQDVQEMVDVVGFRASLMSDKSPDKGLAAEFAVPFERFTELAMMEKSSSELRSRFEAKEVNELKKLFVELECCYDRLKCTRQGSWGQQSNPVNGFRSRTF